MAVEKDIPCTVCGFIHTSEEIDGPFTPEPIEGGLASFYADAIYKHMRLEGWSFDATMRICFYWKECSPLLRELVDRKFGGAR